MSYGSWNLIILLSNPALDLLSQFNPVRLFAVYAFNSSQLNPVKMPFIIVVTYTRNYTDSTSVRILALCFPKVIEGRMNTVTFTNDQSYECVCRSFSLHLCFCLSYYLTNSSPHVFTEWVESKVYNIPVNSWGGKWDCRLNTNGNQGDGKAPLSSFGPRIESLYVVCNGSAAAG